jgi:hypothetical protein
LYQNGSKPQIKDHKTPRLLTFIALFSKHSSRLLEVGIDNRISIYGMRIPSFRGRSGNDKSRI